MSKRKTQYQEGIAWITEFIEAYLREGKTPPTPELEKEIRALEGLRGVQWTWHPMNPLPEEGATVLVEERYNRYDRVLPDEVNIRVVPVSLADGERFQRELVLYPADM